MIFSQLQSHSPKSFPAVSPSPSIPYSSRTESSSPNLKKPNRIISRPVVSKERPCIDEAFQSASTSGPSWGYLACLETSNSLVARSPALGALKHPSPAPVLNRKLPAARHSRRPLGTRRALVRPPARVYRPIAQTVLAQADCRRRPSSRPQGVEAEEKVNHRPPRAVGPGIEAGCRLEVVEGGPVGGGKGWAVLDGQRRGEEECLAGQGQTDGVLVCPEAEDLDEELRWEAQDAGFGVCRAAWLPRQLTQKSFSSCRPCIERLFQAEDLPLPAGRQNLSGRGRCLLAKLDAWAGCRRTPPVEKAIRAGRESVGTWRLVASWWVVSVEQ